jgi:hypothetical protein
MSLSGTIPGKILAIALLIGTLALGYLSLVAPLMERIVSAREALESRRLVLERLEQAIQKAGQATPLVGASPGREDLYLRGESEAVMAALLQSKLRLAGEAEGGRVVSTRSLTAKQQAGLRLIGIEGRLTTSLTGLQKTLLVLEAARPLVLVSALQVTPGGLADGEGSSEQLSVRLEIYGVTVLKSPEAVNVPTPQ